MCGIAGYITVEPSPPQRSVLERMTDALRHRGPDDSDERAALERAGHRYATRSDTETILHAYEQYGPECLEVWGDLFLAGKQEQRWEGLMAPRSAV